MSPERPPKRPWVFYGRWALIPTAIGIGILTFVIVAGDAFAWTLWIGLPLIMVGLGYIFVINTIAALIAIGRSDEEEERGEEKKNAT